MNCQEECVHVNISSSANATGIKSDGCALQRNYVTYNMYTTASRQVTSVPINITFILVILQDEDEDAKLILPPLASVTRPRHFIRFKSLRIPPR